MTAKSSVLVTLDDLLPMPEDGMRREIVRGQLREAPKVFHVARHAMTAASMNYLLGHWLDDQPAPRGQILSRDVGFRLRTDPDSVVGIDIAFVSAAQVTATPETADYLEGPPVLAVEILSQGDTIGAIFERVELYLDLGVALVWLINPYFRTVQVHRPGAEPETFNVLQELTGDPHLPGFRIAVASIFAD